MKPATLDAIRAVIQSDPCRSTAERRALAGLLGAETPTAGIMTRRDVAKLLNRTTAHVDALAREGTLDRVKLPGRVRGCGFRKDQVEKMIEGERHE